MECFNPVRIINPSKVFSFSFADKYVDYVRCGKCAACQQTLQKEWYYRAYYEYIDTIRNGGYMLMDCLTYSPKYVPRVSRYIRIPRSLNFMCFDYTDFRFFMVRLRRYLKKRGYDVEKTLRYFCAAEYGTDETKTHRPHMHILFYVTTPNLDNYTLSRAISACWKYGRTDGIPYKSKTYVDNYTIKNGLSSSQRVCKYVSKYVMKSSEFQRTIDKRLSAIMFYLYENRFTTFRLGDWKFELDYFYQVPKEVFDYNSFESFQSSEFGKKLYRDLKRHLDQFHRQSLGFGVAALGDMDIGEIMETNIISIPDGKSVVMRLGLPMYYKRKLFYYTKKVDGMKIWLPNADGMRYKELRKRDIKKRLIDDYSLMLQNYGYKIDDVPSLVDYVTEKRGRLKNAPFGESTLIDRIDAPSQTQIYNYVTSSDKHYFHKSFLSSAYLGNVNIGYYDDVVDRVDINDFISEFVEYDKAKELILSTIIEKKRNKNDSCQKCYENRQRINQVYKNLYSSR